MGTFKKITSLTDLKSNMEIREFDIIKGEYDNYTIGKIMPNSDLYQLHPEGKNLLNNGVLSTYSKLKMIARGCEYYEE